MTITNYADLKALADEVGKLDKENPVGDELEFYLWSNQWSNPLWPVDRAKVQIRLIKDRNAVHEAIYCEDENGFYVGFDGFVERNEAVWREIYPHSVIERAARSYKPEMASALQFAVKEVERLREIEELARVAYMTSQCKDGLHQDALKDLYQYFDQALQPTGDK